MWGTMNIRLAVKLYLNVSNYNPCYSAAFEKTNGHYSNDLKWVTEESTFDLVY